MENFQEKRIDEMEQNKIKMAEELASNLHAQWKLTRFNKETKTYEPRIKKTIDDVWVKEHGGENNVDIANTPYDKLPEDWKKENRIAARQAIEKIEEALVIIHDKWLGRHEESATPKQLIRYAKLPREDKEKDLLVLRKAIEIIEKDIK